MTKKSQPDHLPPPQSSDEEEDDTGSEQEEEESGSESDDNPKQPQKTQTPTQSDDDSASDESDDDSQANVPTVIIKPISSKPMKKNDNKPNPDSKTVKQDDPGKKRANSEETEKESKKAKKSDEEDSKKPLFQRLFSEEDELVILKSMIDYKNENGIHGDISIPEMVGFYEVVRRLLRVEFSRPQLADKVRRLKRKYNNNLGRESKQKKGKSMSFSRPNEREGYELSKMIWGSGASSSTPNGVAVNEVLMMEGDNGTDVNRFVKYGGGSIGPVLVEEIVKAGMEMVDDEKRKEWEARWKTLKLQELELFAKRTDLVREHVAVVIEGVKSSAI